LGKELCFCINKKNLFLEHVLVDYIGVPIFFLCSDNNQYYLALCTNIDELNYVIVSLTRFDVYHLLHGKVSMCNVILNQKEYWEVISGDEIALDIVTKKTIDQLDVSQLPEADACYQILDEKTKIFVQNFDNNFFNSEYYCNREQILDFNEADINDVTDFLSSHIDRFVNLGEYNFKSILQQPSPLVPGLYEDYMSLITQAATTSLQQLDKSEDWKNNDLINAA
jgi:hypothetical protein